MIRMVQSTSALQAKSYFSDALSRSDYFIGGQELAGVFRGKLAERLNIQGEATKKTFFSLCENINPNTGESLTPRTNDHRTIGYDINFHAPKSVSVAHALTNDTGILEAFNQSVAATMREIEADSMTRVRKAGQYHDRKAGELIYGDFVHLTARPVDGSAPDPHLHSHQFVFNVVWDDVEQQFKAGQFREINRDMPYYQSMFHKEFADRLIKQGYQIRKTAKSFELEGVPRELVDQFCKRTDEIGRIAKEKGVVNAKELAELGAKTRSKKQKGLTMDELRQSWNDQAIATGNRVSIQQLKSIPKIPKRDLTPEMCINHSLQHNFERASVKDKRRLLETAYRHSIGNSSVSHQTIKNQMDKDPRLLTIKDGTRSVCTTREVLREEKLMIDLAREGIGKLRPMYKGDFALTLEGEQAAAVRHVLTTSDRVSIVRGAAGTGKTYLMKEASSMMKQAGKKMFVVAPTAQASRGVLRDDGFKKAETVAMLLTDKKMQEALKGQVLWVDEAGLLGTRDTGKLIDLANKIDCQLVFGGDTRQHASVIRGDALRILNKVGGIKTAEVSKIRRQNDEKYREAIEDLSHGKVLSGFSKLDKIGAIKSTEPEKAYTELVKDYVAAIKKGKTALVISPTHTQGEAVTQAIRQQLRQERKLGKKEISVPRLKNLNLTVAEKQDNSAYEPGQFIQFNRDAKGIKRGSLWMVDVKDGEIGIKDKEGKWRPLPIGNSSKYDVLKKDQMPLSNGDSIRITRNGYDKKGKELSNGQLLKVKALGKNGAIHLTNPKSKSVYTIEKDFGHLTHAHCITSHSAQGKTVDQVFIAQPASTFGATDAKQFYVSASRGKEKATFYTDDKKGFMEHATCLGDRESAHELLGYKAHAEVVAEQERSKVIDTPTREKDKEQHIGYKRPEKDIDHGPRI